MECPWWCPVAEEEDAPPPFFDYGLWVLAAIAMEEAMLEEVGGLPERVISTD